MDSFVSVEDAVMRAPALVTQETKLTIYGTDGQVLAVVYPASY